MRIRGKIKETFLHGEIIGLGIYLMSRLQNNDFKFITSIMDDVSLSYHPKSMMILKKDLIDSILNLRNYVEKNQSYGIQ